MMGEIIKVLTDFLTDGSRKLSHKAGFILSVLMLIVLIDNIIGFSYYYQKAQKLNQLEVIQRLVSDTTLTPIQKQQILEMRDEIFSRQNIITKTVSFFKGFEGHKMYPRKRLTGPTEDQLKSQIHYISSAWFILLIMAILPFALPSTLANKESSTFSTIASFLIFEAFLFGTSLLFSYILGLIPIILESPIINYSINFLFSVILLYGLYKASKKSWSISLWKKKQ